jgi:putative flippase GtrA
MALNLKLFNSSLMARFVLAGVVNTLFGWAVFASLILLGINISISLFFGMTLGVLFNYLTIGGYAFKKFSKKIFLKFMTSNLLIYFLNLFMLSYIQEVIKNIILAQLTLIPFLALISFFIMKNFVFKG